MNKDLFFDYISRSYIKNPSTLPLPLWKIKSFIYSSETYIKKMGNNLYAIHNGSAWIVYPFNQIIEYKDIKSLTSLILNNNQLCDKLKKKKDSMKGIIKVYNSLEGLKELNLPNNLHFKKVRHNQDNSVSEFISLCYDELSIKKEFIQRIKLHPTFDKSFWWWLTDKDNNKIALAIGEYDEDINEGSMEWIQVHPDYRKKGYGSLIVNKLLNEMSKKCSFVTASTEHFQSKIVEDFYKKNGFTNKETWWIVDTSLI